LELGHGAVVKLIGGEAEGQAPGKHRHQPSTTAWRLRAFALKISASDLFCGFAVNHPRIGPRMREFALIHSSIREKFVDGLVKNSQITKSGRIRKI